MLWLLRLRDVTNWLSSMVRENIGSKGLHLKDTGSRVVLVPEKRMSTELGGTGEGVRTMNCILVPMRRG